jgi:hypothetical protein
MAKVKSFHSSCGISLDIKGTWHKFQCGIEVEIEEGDDLAKVKEMAHNTVQVEVEKQIQGAIDAMADTTAK